MSTIDTEQTRKKGSFIVIDGTDGSGKATQTSLLVERFKAEGYAVEMADFPQYGAKSAGPVEEYLNGKYGQLAPRPASILYAVDRFDASFTIRKWLEDGKVVVANRYVTANAGHQGGKISDDTERRAFFAWLDELEYKTFGIPAPDLNIILHLPADVAQRLVDRKAASVREYAHGKKRDLHEADLNHLKNAEKVYLEIAAIFPNTELVECMDNDAILPPDRIHGRIWDIVKEFFSKTGRRP